MTQKTPKLKKCPFCNGKPMMAQNVSANSGMVRHVVICETRKCRLSSIPLFSGCYLTVDEAAKQWNTRKGEL